MTEVIQLYVGKDIFLLKIAQIQGFTSRWNILEFEDAIHDQDVELKEGNNN